MLPTQSKVKIYLWCWSHLALPIQPTYPFDYKESHKQCFNTTTTKIKMNSLSRLKPKHAHQFILLQAKSFYFAIETRDHHSAKSRAANQPNVQRKVVNNSAGSSFVFVRLLNERTRTRNFVHLVKQTNMNRGRVRSLTFVNIRTFMFDSSLGFLTFIYN
ncbi:hypothetical protein HanIR_Chr03g0128691 [Helianthus annuus]|nr:hypothetical protein HanIR_Chr03g0128691 [Helianthus annuus]